MAGCESMKIGEVYSCKSCGFEIEVKNTCGCKTDDNCEPHVHDGVCCDIVCCGNPISVK